MMGGENSRARTGITALDSEVKHPVELPIKFDPIARLFKSLPTLSWYPSMDYATYPPHSQLTRVCCISPGTPR